MPANSRPKKIIAVDWDAHTLRLVHAFLSKRGVKIDKLLAVAIPDDVAADDPEKMGSLIRRTLDQEGITTRHAIVDVPRDQTILKTLSLPTTHVEELPGMVEIQIAKELPFPVSEAVVDFAVSPSSANSASGDVLVGAVRREVLQQIEDTFHAAGLKLDRVGLRPYANKVAVDTLLEHGMPERVVFIDVRRSFMEIDVLRSGALTFSRSASVTIPRSIEQKPTLLVVGDDDDGAVSASAMETDSSTASGTVPGLGALLLELTRSIEAYRATDPGARIDHVVIGGDVGVEEAFAELIGERLSVTTQLYNPATSFGWEPDEGAAASGFAASLGLVLGHAGDDKLHFDFLHPKQTVSVVQERLRRAPLVATVAFLFLGAVGVAFAEYTKPARTTLGRLEKEIRTHELDRKANEKFLKLVGEVVEFDEQQHVWIDVLYEIISILPSNQEIVIKQLDMNQKDGRVTLKTRTTNRDTAIQIIRSLRAYRREERTRPRFDGSIGPQTQKKGEKYPYHQDIKIMVLDDTPRKKKSGKKSSGV